MIFQQPNFFGCLEPAPDLAAAATDAGALPVAHVDPVSLGVLEAPGNYGCRDRDRRGAERRQLPVLRRPALRLPRREGRVHPPAAGTDHRRDDRPGRRARLRADAADARAAHPPREGDVEHHHEPDAARARRPRPPVLARPAGPARAGRDLHGPRRLREGAARTASSRFPERTTFKEFAIRVRRNARDVITDARAHGVHPGYALGRDYEGWTTRCSSRSPRSAARATSTGSPRCSTRWAHEARSTRSRRPAAARRRCRATTCRPSRCPRSCAARSRRDCPSSPSPRSSGTSPSSRRATSASTPASTRSAPAR